MSAPLFPGAPIGDRYLLALVAWYALISDESRRDPIGVASAAFDHADAMLAEINRERSARS